MIGMASMAVKRICDTVTDEDGDRILNDRLWSRGISKERAALAEWDKDVAPSPELRKWFGHDSPRFTAFSVRYRDELISSPAAEALAVRCREQLECGRNVTLLYAAKGSACNHTIALKDWLVERLGC